MPNNWLDLLNHLKELIRGKLVTVKNAENELEALWLAIQLESGDDVWADKHEAQYPLASWIATTEQPLCSMEKNWRFD